MAIDHTQILTIEAAAGRAWSPQEVESLHGWVLRSGGARTRRRNSVQTLSFAGGDVDAAIAAAETWYRARRLPPCFQINDAVRPTDLDARLAARGYPLLTPTSVMVAERLPREEAASVAVELVPEADARVLAAICDPAWPAEIRRDRAALFAAIRSVHRFALVTIDGTAAGGGLCAVEAQLAGLFTMRTQPAYRGRGLARAVALRLIAWAESQGAQQLYLQVEDDNEPALRLYRHMGFRRVYGYHYREKD